MSFLRKMCAVWKEALSPQASAPPRAEPSYFYWTLLDEGRRDGLGEVLGTELRSNTLTRTVGAVLRLESKVAELERRIRILDGYEPPGPLSEEAPTVTLLRLESKVEGLERAVHGPPQTPLSSDHEKVEAGVYD